MQTSEAGPKDTLMVNLYGAPSSGKTTTAAELFSILKKRGVDAFQIQEYASYLIAAGRTRELRDEQGLIFAKQNHKQQIAKGRFAVAITESPITLCSFYAPPEYPGTFHPFVLDVYAGYRNVAYFINKKDWADYTETGRVHKKEESMEIEGRLKRFLADNGISFTQVPLDVEPAVWIADDLTARFRLS